MTGRGLRDTVRMERVRVTTARANYLVVLLALATGAFVALMVALLVPRGALSPGRTVAALTVDGGELPVAFVGAVAAVLAVTTVAHDYRFGLVRVVLAVQPRRGTLIAGRLVVLAVVAAGLALTVSLLGAVICWAVGRPPAHDPATLRQLGWHAGVCVLWAWFGAALAWILRGTAGPVAIMLLGALLVEPLLQVVAEQEGTPAARAAVRRLPFEAAHQALGRGLGAGPDTIGAVEATAVFGGTTLALLGLAWLLLARRDA